MQEDSVSRPYWEVYENIQQVYEKIGALDTDDPEVAQIIEQINAIAQEIIILADHEVPTMKKM